MAEPGFYLAGNISLDHVSPILAHLMIEIFDCHGIQIAILFARTAASAGTAGELERPECVSIPSEDLKKCLAEAGVILLKHGQLKAGTNIDAVIDDYIRTEFAQKAPQTKP